MWNDRPVVDVEAPPAEGATDLALPAAGGSDRVARWTLRGGLTLLGVQAVFLAGLSVVVFRRFTLAIDFGIFSQAWTRIGTGHLNPESTVNRFPYIKSHFELLMWPLALLHPIVHSSIVLLFVQDAALVVAEMVVLVWVAALLRRAAVGTAWTVAVTIGVVLLLLVNPLVYGTATEDFHFEPIATCFIVLAAYDLWSGRTTRLWVWVVLCLACGDIGGLYVLGLGLSGVVAAQGDRSKALVLLGVGIAWVGLISVLGANAGSGISTGYAYLANQHTLPGGSRGLMMLVGGVVGHPDRAWDAVFPRWGTLFRYLESGGVVGMFTPWGFGVPLVALGTASLQQDGIFLSLPFQNVVVVPFVTFGSAWFVVWIVAHWRSWIGTTVAALVGVGALTAGGVAAAQELPTAFTINATAGIVPADRAAVLAKVLARTPGDAEVIASVPTIGRFGQRQSLYPLIDEAVGTTVPIPIRGSAVMVVMDSPDAPQLLPPSIEQALVSELVRKGARVVVSESGVTAVLWNPPSGTTALRLP